MDWKKKLSSRKLWAAVVGLIVGIAAAFGIRENEWEQTAGIVTAAASVVAYILGESRIDAAAATPVITIDSAVPDDLWSGGEEAPGAEEEAADEEECADCMIVYDDPEPEKE